jgi:hypothetical protein
MRGQTSKNIIGENLRAAISDVYTKQEYAVRRKLCWQCQKDKSPIGGSIKTWAGGSKFVCKSCMDLALLKKDAKKQ